MTNTRSHRRIGAATIAASVVVAMLAACTSDTDKNPTSPPTSGAASAATDDPIDLSMCEPGPDKVVTMLDDVVIPAQEEPAVLPYDATVGDATITIPGVEAVVIPERVGEAGCIVTYKAPGGCLGAVEISGAYIPAYTIPERRLPEVTLPDGTVLEEVVLPAKTTEAVTVAGARQDQVCQVTKDKKDGDWVSGVSRSGISRSGISQSGVSQSGASRSGVTVDGDYVPSVYVSSIYVESMYVESAYVESGYLESQYLEGTDDVETSTEDDTTSYTAQGDVLFDSDKDVLRPEAETGLTAILKEITTRPESATILVEGHTDNIDSEEHNLDLSQRRAEAVAAWLVAQGIDESRISTVGHGLAYPRADNATDEGRALNRRVVITVTG